MGKSIPSSVRIQELTRIFSSSPDKLHHRPPKQARPPFSKKNRIDTPKNSKLGGPTQQKRILKPPAEQKSTMEEGGDGGAAVSPDTEGLGRSKLSQVVADCVRRWFLDTLKEAKAGDTAMQILVGQMYNSGYGVAKDPQKGRAWINRASKNRSSVWQVGQKQPGYNASDSDSDVKGAAH